MLTVKNENISVVTVGDSESSKTLKPLESPRLSVSDKNAGAGAAAQEPAAAAGSARLGHPDPARTASGFDPDDIKVALGVIATALMLTYGNAIMEILFRIMGI